MVRLDATSLKWSKKFFWIKMADEIHHKPHAGSKELVAYNKGKLEE